MRVAALNDAGNHLRTVKERGIIQRWDPGSKTESRVIMDTLGIVLNSLGKTLSDRKKGIRLI